MKRTPIPMLVASVILLALLAGCRADPPRDGDPAVRHEGNQWHPKSGWSPTKGTVFRMTRELTAATDRTTAAIEAQTAAIVAQTEAITRLLEEN